MITIRRVRIKDFGPIDEFEYVFPRLAGTFAIRAPNGSGKSHLVGALMATSTNLIMPEKPRGALVRNYGLEGETARIEVEYDVDGEPLVVSRTITAKGSGSSGDVAAMLARGGYPDATTRHAATFRGHKYTKAGDIEELIASTFGINNPVQTQAVFVPQGKAGEIWRGTQASRAAAFQFLSGADQLAELHRYVGKCLDQYKATDYTEELAIAKADVQRLDAALAGAKRKLAEMPEAGEDLSALYAQLHQMQDARKAAEENQRINQKIQECAQQAQQHARRITELQKAREALGLSAAGAQELAGKIATAKEIVRRDAASATTKNEINLLEQRILDLHNRLGSVQLDDPNVVAKYVQDLQETVASVTAALGEISASLHRYGETGTCPTCGSSGKCPNCGHITLDLETSVRQWQENRHAFQAQLNDLNSRLQEGRQRHQAANDAVRRHDRDNAQLQEWRAAKKAAEDALQPSSPEEVAEANRILGAQAHLDQFNQLLREENAARKEVDRLKATVDSLMPQRKAQEGGVDVSPARESALNEQIQRQTALSAERGNLEGNIKGLSAQADSAKARIASLEEKMRANEKTARIAEFLGGIKTATHPNAIPKDRAVAYINRVNRHLGIHCRELRLPFSLSVDPDSQDLMCATEELKAPAQHRLSEGQRTMAAWAWILSLHAIHAGRVGFLVMDEPTVGLDAENRACVADAVRRLAGFCRDSGTQVILVTHDEDLAAAFDVSIELKQSA